MGSLTAAIMIGLLNLDTAFDDATMENIIDEAINLLNLFGTIDLPNMVGVAGSKTVGLSSPQQGAVVMVTKTIYKEFYEDDEGSMTLGGVAISAPAMLGNSQIMKNVKESARLLYRRENSMEVSVG